MSKFIVPDKVKINLAEVKDDLTCRWHGINPFFNVYSFLFVTLGQTFKTFSFYFDKKSILGMEKHVNE